MIFVFVRCVCDRSKQKVPLSPPPSDDDDDGTEQLKKLGTITRYLDLFHHKGVFIRRGLKPNSVAVGTA